MSMFVTRDFELSASEAMLTRERSRTFANENLSQGALG
jgi:hypothetical protein